MPGYTHYVVELYESGETCSIKHRLPVLEGTAKYSLEKVVRTYVIMISYIEYVSKIA